MTVLGSVFLGDAHHNRAFPTTPPRSPPPSSLSAGSGVKTHQNLSSVTAQTMQTPLPLRPPQISPEIALELRVRWLEALLLGVRQDMAKERRKGASKGHGNAAEQDEQKQEPLYRKVKEVQQRLDAVVASNDGLKRFMEHYDKHAQFLMPSFALSGLSNTYAAPPSYSSMSSAELEVFLSEMESDIRAAERDLREIDALEKRGVTAAGKLTNYEPLSPRLRALAKAHEEDIAKASSLENRIAVLLEKHAGKVDALSELFVAWNDVISDAEDRVNKAEREKEGQKRLGFE